MTNSSIYISPILADNNTQRLNYIPGRTLSEQEFDLMQVYVDERCEDLLVGRTPGIVQGLDLVLPQADKTTTAVEALNTRAIQINAGVAVSFSGKAITNRLPIRFYWQDLKDQYLAEKTLLEKVKNGVYFLTLRRKNIIMEEAVKQDPNTRTELNPLRDTRIETLAQVNLQEIRLPTSVLQKSRQSIAVSVLQKIIEETLFTENPDEIKLAMVKITDEEIEWIDNLAGRFLARENSVYFTLMDYWHAILNSRNPFRLDDRQVVLSPTTRLADLFDVNCLPAAGKFPSSLLSDLAGKPVLASSRDTGQWARPNLAFSPSGLQIEMLPIPENAIQGILQNEISRGVIDLKPGTQDRLRILVAVKQDDYHPKLMDLPEIDLKLIKDYLVPKQKEAVIAHELWEKAFIELYGGLTRHIRLTNGDDKKITIEKFSSIYLTDISKIILSGVSDENKKLLGIPKKSVPEPRLVPEALDDIANGKLSRPFSLVANIIEEEEIPDGDSVVNLADSSGKFDERFDVMDDIDTLEDLILKTNQLIDELRDYLSLQRQQLDSITVGFSSIAGGIPGDGSGLKLMRWSDKLTLTNKLITKPGA
jgi:hypothetical protein